MWKFLVVALSISLALPSEGATPCNARRFNHDSVVCVCNENFCDTLDPIQPTPRGLVRIYESDRAGKRLEMREEQFGNDPPGPIPWPVDIERSQKFQEIIGFGGNNQRLHFQNKSQRKNTKECRFEVLGATLPLLASTDFLLT